MDREEHGLPLLPRVLGMGLAATAAVLAVRGVARLSRRIDFDGRVALVTGGTRGLGLILARRLLAEGARVVICGRDVHTLETARRDLESRGGQVLAVACDVTDPDQVHHLVEQAVERFGGIDIVINNAGIIGVGPAEVMSEEDYRNAMETHVWGPIRVTEAALPHLRRSSGGRIVNITSIGGKISVPHLLPYSVSKFALVGFSEGLRAEMLRHGVYVTTVCPGLMRTGSPRNARFKGQHRTEYALFKLTDSLPLLSMNADRAAAAILEACRFGDAEIVLSLPAKLATTFHGLFPGLTSDVAGLVNWLLPAPGGIGRRAARGADSETRYSENIMTRLTDRAAEENNEMDTGSSPT